MARALFHTARRRSKQSPGLPAPLPKRDRKVWQIPARQSPADILSPPHKSFPASRIPRRERPCILFRLRQDFRHAFALSQLQNVNERYPEVIEKKRRPAEAEEPRSKISTSLELL